MVSFQKLPNGKYKGIISGHSLDGKVMRKYVFANTRRECEEKVEKFYELRTRKLER